MKKAGIVLVSLGLAFSLAGCGGKSAKDASSESAAEEVVPVTEQAEAPAVEEETEDDLYFFKDLKVVAKDYTIQITDWRVIPAGEEGNSYGDAPVLAFWYDTTNTSGKEIDPSSAWIYIMEAVQDNDPNAINKLNVASHPDSSLVDSQMAEIKEGGTVANAIAYTLTDSETPVELTAKNGMLGDAIGTMTFDIVAGEATNGGTATIGTIEKTENVEPSFEGNIITTKDFTLEILEYKIIPVGEEGNTYGDSPVIAFWYNTTNTSGKNIDPSTAWISTMTAIQDNDPNMVNKLDVAPLPDSDFLDSQIATIKAGGTVENAVAYVLTDQETPVELIAQNGLLGDELGRKAFEVK